MAADRDIELVQDRVLAERARRGERRAFDELYTRHAGASWRLALAVTRHPGAAESAVASAFATTLAGRAVAVPSPDSLRLRLLVATRHAAMATAGDETSARAASGALDLEPTVGSADVVRQAFDALPERLRSILWLVDAEGCPLAAAEAVLELEDGAAGPLADRARLGLQERVLQADPRPTAAACRRTTDSLVGYAGATLAPRDENRVRKHLDACAGCRARLAALDDLVPALRTAARPLPVFMADEAARRWSAALVRDSGPLHLVLPGGQPVPAWAQKTIAGTVAGVIALGIAGATILAGGRGGRGAGTALPVTSAASLDADDGESALGLDDLVIDGTGFVPPATGSTPAAPKTPPSAHAAPSGDALPRSAAATPPASAGLLAPAPTNNNGGSSTPAPGTPTPTPPTPPPAPTPTAPFAEVTVTVPDVGSVTIGDQCTGIELLGTVIGCPAPATEDPAIVSTGGSLLPPISLGL